MGADLETDLAAEEQFGPYLVYERLGVGGMATVHRALERGIEGFERIVALKRLLPHLAEDASFIKSFVREAKLASLLNHHNIVQIYELGRVATEYFISMEYIDGRDIRRILRHARKVSGAPPVHVTVGILLQLAEALDYAHTKCDEQGQPLKLVHRDISPSNLIVNPAGHLKVIDFGIAKAQSSQLRTQTGRVKGKLAYMAPEAVTSGKDLDARSDLWAVGVIAHELLTARPLFARKNEYETLLKVQKSDIAKPSTFNESCPPELDAIVLKLLARDPDERYLDAAALREALIDLRRKLKLATSTRDIATWLDWAFSLETPGGFSQGTVDRSGSGAFDLQAAARSLSTMAAAHQTPAPKPRREDDEAVEIAWGGGEEHEAAGKPIELDDVPDVSAKFTAARNGARNTVRDPDFDDQHSDEHDDIPAPEPSHGVLRPKRDTDRSAAVPLPLPAPPKTPVPPPRERRSTAKGVSARPDTLDVPSGVLGVDRSHARALSEISAEAEPPLPRDTQPSPIVAPAVEPERPSAPPERKSLDDMVDDQLIATQPRPRRTPRESRPSQQPISIGDAIVARESVRSRAWIWILGLVVIGAGAAAYAMFMTGGDDAATQVADTSPAANAGAAAKVETKEEPKPQKGTLRFVVEPADVSISIEGVAQHEGSPWSLELPPGAHKVELRRSGYKPRVTSIELSPNETQTLLVTLEKAPRKIGRDMNAQATLILDSEPQGLEVIIDGRMISDRTPVTRVINAGAHVIALRQNGVEVWRQNLVAEADADHEFRPVFSEQKKRERRQRIVGNPSERAVETADAAASVDPPPEVPAKTETAPIAITPKIELPPTPPAPLPPPPAPKTKPVAVPHTGPVMVAPNAVRRVAGETPTLGASKPENMPSVVAAKVCIDTSGAVSSIDIITKLERHTTVDLVSSMKAWRYAPYKQPDGTAVPACFSVNFRVK